MMALYGFMLEDHTYINEVKKMSYSTVVSYDIATNTVSTKKLHQYSTQTVTTTYKKALSRVDELMTISVNKIWDKSTHYSDKHLSFLSGGMDVRTNVLLAKEAGATNITAITFGASNSKDIAYAKKIAKGENIHHLINYLNSPEYLVENILENYIKPLDGLMMFHTSAHASYTIRKLNPKGFHLIHTGQIGDTMFGAFSKKKFDFHANRSAIGYTGFVSNTSLLDKITVLPAILNTYQEKGIELFTYEQRQINATLMGDRNLYNIIDSISPFCDLELINYLISLPFEFKKDRKIYFDWLKKYHPQVLEYPWDKINMKPNHPLKTKYGAHFKKYYNGAKKYFKLKYDSMNPYQVWLTEDPSIIKKLDQIVNEGLETAIWNKELKEDLLKIYSNNIFEFRNKFAVATAVMAVNYHFPNT